jgi:hypothetical protein
LKENKKRSTYSKFTIAVNLEQYALPRVWQHEIERLREEEKDTADVDVLFWKSLFFEVLKNLFINVHHNLEQHENAPEGRNRVRLTVDPVFRCESEDTTATETFWQIEVTSTGRPFLRLPLQCTFMDHQTEVREMGGQLEIIALTGSDESGAIATLTLRARKPVPSSDLQEQGGQRGAP